MTVEQSVAGGNAAVGVKYPVAPGGLFDTIQGEGALLGVPMHFARLAGCSVGCEECDTDYRVAVRLPAGDVVSILRGLPPREWVWVTGGEPTDHDLGPLFAALRAAGYRIALATAGTREAPACDFLSVSPHVADGRWRQRSGDQINLVPGLNGLRLADFDAGEIERSFPRRYVTPLHGDAASLAGALAFVRASRGWRLGTQAHKGWGLP